MAKSLAELNKEIMRKVNAAMKEVNYLALGDMRMGLDYFYGGGSPKQYTRTGQMGRTPKVTSVISSGTSASFDAFLYQGGGYTTGKRPSMATVLQLANYGNISGYRPTVGSKGFWEYSENLIEDSLNEVFSYYFD